LFCSSYIWFFFFSSRRRHTRWPRDWSSDVCSSDLAHPEEGPVLEHPQGLNLRRGRHLPDLVEEDGATVGQLEATQPPLGGAGEQIGRASCRERGEIAGVAGSVEKKRRRRSNREKTK